MDTIHTIGRRKSAVARIYMSKGKGKITVNNSESNKYFTTATLLYKLNQPFSLVDMEGKFDVKVNVKSIAPPKKEQDSNLIKGKKIPNIQNIIAVASGKGGVGKSTITANTAISLAKMGFKVGVLDADIYGPSMHLMFDVEKERPISVNMMVVLK